MLAAVVCIGRVHAAGFSFFEPVQPPRRFQVIAHRGASQIAPENTRSALQGCIDDGLEWAEVDVRRTRDGQHLLAHDAGVRDAKGKVWPIAEHTLAELRHLDVGSRFAPRFAGETLLTLEEAFAIGKERLNLYLDCKEVNADQLIHEIRKASMQQQVVVYGGLPTARRIRDATSGRIATMTKWQPNHGGPEWAVSNGLAAVEIDAPHVTPEIVEAFHRAGVKVQAKVLGNWDQPQHWDRMFTAGVDWLQTDLPEEVLAQALWRRVKQRPVAVALHRGANRYAPENTLPAFAKAVRLGADYVEFDVRATADGAFYLLHDSRLDRTTDGTGPLLQCTAAAVRKLSAGIKFGPQFATTPLPTLDEFLGGFAGRVGFYLDAKAISPEALAEALQRHHVTDQTVVYQSPEYLQRLKNIDPRIRTLAPLNQPEDFAALMANLKPYGVDAAWDILSKELIDRCHAAGVKVFSDSLGEHERIGDYLQAIEWGVDVISTDHPLRLLRAIELWAGGNSAGVKDTRGTGK